MARQVKNDEIFVGIPCFNRPDGLQRTIECMQAQTHRRWRALISDNASTDPQVEVVGRSAVERDPRFSYVQQSANIGAVANFRFVADQADAPYFMWASDDDLWEPDFMAALLNLFAEHPDCQMTFASIDNINKYDIAYRTYPGFTRLNAGENRQDDALKFLQDPEIMGKANLIYGLFRRETLMADLADYWDAAALDGHGGDVVFMFGFIARHPVIGTDRVLLHKRVATDKTRYRLKRDPRSYFVRLGQYRSYVERHLAVAPNEAVRAIVRQTMRRRLWEKYLSRIGLAAL